MPKAPGVTPVRVRECRWSRYHTSRRVADVMTIVALLVGAIFILLPIFWIVDTAFKPVGEAFVLPPKVVYSPTLVNFRAVIGGPSNQYVADLGHSAIIMVVSVGIALALGVPAGYGLARSRFRGSGAIGGWLVVAYMVPALIYLVPLYTIYVRLGLSGSYLSIILYYETFEMPFVVFMMRSYFADLPRELEDAARVDGCSRWKTFRRVMLPLVIPGLSTVTMLCSIGSWGEFFGAFILTGSSTITAPVAIEGYIGQGTSDWSALAAAALLLVLPVLVLTGFIQRGYIKTFANPNTG